MRKKLLLVSILLGIVFDVLFWKKIPGISFAIFTTLCLASGYWLLRSQAIQPARLSGLLLAPVIFFSVMTFTRLEPFTLFTTSALTLLCMAILVITYRSGLWLSFGLADYVKNLFALFVSILISGWKQISQPDLQPGSDEASKKPNDLWPILRGLLLALPIMIVFTALLSSADLIFGQKVKGLLTFLRLQNPAELFFRGMLIFLISYALIGIFWHAANRSQSEGQASKDHPFLAPFLGFTEASIILGSIILLFSAFVLTQFQYFFSGQANITLEGFTYSEYARRGFGELLTVAILNLILLQSLNTITISKTKRQSDYLSALGIGLITLVIIILISSFQRLQLYEAAYGFSRLRVYARVLIIWLGILLVCVAGMQALNRQRAFATVLVMCAVGFTASLSLLNVDAFITRQNIQRAMQGSELDSAYLSTLTSDAVPALVETFTAGALPADIKEEIGAVLACFSSRAHNRSAQHQAWQSFNISDWQAARAIHTIKPNLSAYQIQKDSLSISLDKKQWVFCGWDSGLD